MPQKTDMLSQDDVLAFWFPAGHDRDHETHLNQNLWWFRGGADEAIRVQGGPLFERALAGDCDGWAETTAGRLALILVLDQFPRSLFRGEARTYSGDPLAQKWAIEGVERGMYAELASVWEKQFFVLPFSHSEDINLQEWSVVLAEARVLEAPEHLRKLYEFAASQARGHRDTVARFGRQPHRNSVLGRVSTPEELEYIAAGDFVHQRPIPK
jgi:uncharacterized protein (DUF924 family)